MAQDLTETRPGNTVATASTSVEFVDVTRVFGKTTALAGFTLEIKPGELLALLGPSGCGKTTALRILAGFDNPTTGSVLVGGGDVTRIPVNKRDMGMVFQSYSLFPTMTARDNVAFGLQLRKQPATKRRQTAGELLELVGLGAHTDKYPHQLSGGQQQRVALARALAIQPRVLLLDEPLSALDAKVREQLRDEIRRIQTEVGVTTVIVTHDQEEALSMADRVAVMNAGRLEQCATPAELYARPATVFVAEFVGTMNHISGVAEDGGFVRVLGQRLQIDGAARAVGDPVKVLVRPEAVTVRAGGDWTVVGSNFRGATTRLLVSRDGEPPIRADVTVHQAADLPMGSPVTLMLADRPVLLAQ
ncbi:ABC transporter ATP-binding protein [Nocardioides baekrokdamisoli]|uniref:ABC-type quaternary amine transporter n=1 Tax=Nocardioides baekrokdamisoli TaxID=1804624 RepID=A0A3G9IDN8_9ACTN|nr:ABC transporter ATP-binding protein [Nocardioides baekrokdamisoli]BBH16482.1 ABC transporter ATP-binding protein [Nocardioides baekrokdamisoli]